MCPCSNRKATARRFLVARKYKLDDAEKMMRDAIAWRQTVPVGDAAGVDNALFCEATLGTFGRQPTRSSPLPPLHCYAKQGYPVYMLRLGRGDGVLATTAAEECHVYASISAVSTLAKVIIPEAQKFGCRRRWRLGEAMVKRTREAAGEDIDPQLPWRMMPPSGRRTRFDGQAGGDCRFRGHWHSLALRCLYVFKCINFVASYNYPELSKAIYVLNSPSVFDYLWSAIKPLLATHTQSKIRIFQSGAEQYAALQQILEGRRHPHYLTPQSEGEPRKGKTGSVTRRGPLLSGPKASRHWTIGLNPSRKRLISRAVRFGRRSISARTELENAQSGTVIQGTRRGFMCKTHHSRCTLCRSFPVFRRDAQPQVFYLHHTASSFSLCRNLLAFTGSSFFHRFLRGETLAARLLMANSSSSSSAGLAVSQVFWLPVRFWRALGDYGMPLAF